MCVCVRGVAASVANDERDRAGDDLQAGGVAMTAARTRADGLRQSVFVFADQVLLEKKEERVRGSGDESGERERATERVDG